MKRAWSTGARRRRRLRLRIITSWPTRLTHRSTTCNSSSSSSTLHSVDLYRSTLSGATRARLHIPTTTKANYSGKNDTKRVFFGFFFTVHLMYLECSLFRCCCPTFSHVSIVLLVMSIVDLLRILTTYFSPEQQQRQAMWIGSNMSGGLSSESLGKILIHTLLTPPL